MMSTEQKTAMMRQMEAAIKPTIPAGWAVAIIAVPVGVPVPNGGEFGCNMNKEDAIYLLRDTADRIERNLNKSQ